MRWLKNKLGVDWQIVPTALHTMLNDADALASQRALTAMLQIKKLDIAAF